MVIITLLSDFGLKDQYVAQMKAVILSLCPNADIVDISHGVERHNIAMGSYLLETTAPYFPDGTIHVAVVDPGVGGSRLPVVAVCEHSVLVGPDNGLLLRASKKLGFKAAYWIRNREFVRERPSSTFHGRDVFAPTAGKIAAGHKPRETGPRVTRLVGLDIPSVHVSKQRIACNVLHVDAFGNVILNVIKENVKRFGLRPNQTIKISARGQEHQAMFVKSYFDVASERLAVLWGSQGYLEVALPKDNAARLLGVEAFDPMELSFN